jgi:hypothetical protein
MIFNILWLKKRQCDLPLYRFSIEYRFSSKYGDALACQETRLCDNSITFQKNADLLAKINDVTSGF